MESCIAPPELRRYFRIRNTEFPMVQNAVKQVLAEDPDRVGLIFGNSSATVIFLSPDRPSTLGTGLPITQAFANLALNHAQYGLYTQCAWYANTASLGLTLFISELILDSSRIGR